MSQIITMAVQRLHDQVDTRPTAAILVVNGGGDPAGGSWIELCLSRVCQHTDPADYELYLWNNNPGSSAFAAAVARYAPGACVFEPEPGERLRDFHAVPLQRMYEQAARHGHEWIVTLDSDAHPLRDGWLQELMTGLRGSSVLGGVWRDELQAAIEPYIHASCLCVRRDFIERFCLRFDQAGESVGTAKIDTLSHLTRVAVANGLGLLRWQRSNRGELHYLIGGIYGDRIYHHGAGSRRGVLFWGETDSPFLRRLNTCLAQGSAALLMRDPGKYIGFLRSGRHPGFSPMWWLLRWIARGDPTVSRRLVLRLYEWLDRAVSWSGRLFRRVGKGTGRNQEH